MERLKQFRPCADLAVEYRQEEDEPAELIIRTAVEDHCDLIIMGTHGHRGLRDVLLGSVAERGPATGRLPGPDRPIPAPGPLDRAGHGRAKGLGRGAKTRYHQVFG